MKNLLKQYGFHNDMQYFEMIVESIVNGQRSQAKEQFTAMPVQARKEFIKAVFRVWDTTLSQRDKEIFIDLV